MCKKLIDIILSVSLQYQELNISLHCGVIPTTNDELYGNSDVSPFGKYPFIVIIEDEYYVSLYS